MSHCNAFDSSSFGNCLAELRVSELLLLKYSLDKLSVKEEIDQNRFTNSQDIQCAANGEATCIKPSAMALLAEEKSYAGSHPVYEPWQPEEKPSKLQTLFQISVTALAFLSFGGYLLCLIVQSIKSKGTTYFHPAVTTMATNNSVKRIKVYKRSRRSSLSPSEFAQNYHYYGYPNSYNVGNNPYQYYQKRRVGH